MSGPARNRRRRLAAHWKPSVTVLVIATLVFSGRYFQDEATKIYRQQAAIAGNVERIKYYDTVLTDSARLAAATDNPAHERRYRKAAPELDRLLSTTVELVGTEEARTKLAQTATSNQALIRMELRAFELDRNGQGAKALALLGSDRYAREKSLYALTSAGAYNSFLASSDARTRRVNQHRQLALLIALLGGMILLVVGAIQLRMGRNHDRLIAESERSREIEAVRALAEREYHATQREFTEIMQVTRDEDEAYGLLKRHLERSLSGSEVSVLKRNNSDNRLELATALAEGSPLLEKLQGAEPESCLAIRLGTRHDRTESHQALLACELCGAMGAVSTCVPSLVGGEVIGSVLVKHPSPLDGDDQRRVEESVAQASPVLANLRNLALSQSRALTDGLTGLPNRRAIEDTFKRMTAQASRTETSLSAVLFDLDHFKQVNDLFGHEKGDEVLAAVGTISVGTVRASDFVGRHGGEEFIVLLPDTDRESAVGVAEKLREAIATIDVAGVSRPIRASFGVAALPEDAADSALLLRAADRALYVAKAHGRNRVETVAAEEPLAQASAQ